MNPMRPFIATIALVAFLNGPAAALKTLSPQEKDAVQIYRKHAE
jgi:hypothetical protein